ncbi:MAG: Rpn family recombination-promoting nuclease/putative transposase [Alphaproteobacteria bacterium]|nr:Rpn family recombination-promoting nuclease/putative transposase [Alphaproteobacteria bacterium]
MMDSDPLYHRLFSHPLMVEGLVREFVPEAMASGIDFARMELVNVKFHSRKGRRREGDVVWRLPTRDGQDIYLYILLEFQSKIDKWMAVRMQVYVGLLWQQIIKEHKLKRQDTLPPVLPIVLYNGDRPWDAPTELTDLITLPPDSALWHWQPRVRYYLLDESAFPRDDLARRESLAALLFRLEHCHEPDELVGLIDEVINWFRQHPDYDTLQHLFTEVVQQAAQGLKNQGTVIAIPEGMLEVRTMLATRVQEWTRKWKAEGIAEGRVEGKAEMLLRQLRRRFDTLPVGIEDRVCAAGIDQLDDWSERFVDGKPLSEIFGTDQTH